MQGSSEIVVASWLRAGLIALIAEEELSSCETERGSGKSATLTRSSQLDQELRPLSRRHSLARLEVEEPTELAGLAS